MRPAVFKVRGFTLIELIMVMVLLSALAVLGSVFIVQPFVAFDDTRRRADLVEAADSALMLMTREVRAALPNSVRATDDVLEFIPTLGGGRYRARLAAGAPAAPDPCESALDLSGPDLGFEVLGGLVDPLPAAAGVVIYNLAAAGTLASAYSGDNRATLAASSSAACILLGDSTGTPGFRFPLASPTQRFQLIGQPISYRCNGDGTLTRHQGYGFSAAMPVALGSGAIVADRVESCAFSFDAGAGSRNGLVTVRLTLSQGGESISLLQQIHVLNAP